MSETLATPAGEGHEDPTASLFASYWGVLDGFKRTAVVAIILTILSGLLETVGILAIVPIISGQKSLSVLGVHISGSAVQYWSLAAFGLFAIASSVVKLLSDRWYIRLTGRFEEACRRRLTHLVLRMDWSKYLRVRVGELNASMLLTIHQIAAGAQYFMRGVGLLGVAVVFGIAAFFLSWQLSLVSLGFSLLAVIAYLLGVRPIQHHTKILVDTTSELGHQTEVLFSNLKLFRSLGQRRSSEKQMESIFRRYAEAYTKGMFVVPVTRSLFEVTASIAVVILLTIAIFTSKSGVIPASSIAFLVLFFRLMPRLVSTQENLQNARTYRRYCEPWQVMLKSFAEAQDTHIGSRPPAFASSLKAEDVGFSYPGTRQQVLSHLNWELNARETIAFVGDSGAGKTTILDLVTGLLRPTSGAITVDGVSLTDLEIEAWQSRIGLVLQDSPLFGRSILENVWWTEPDHDEGRARECLEMAQAWEFVGQLESGIHTIIGERGASLSGGQRQRLALARALYRQPWLLILDEPTSALDRRAEAEVLRALQGIKSTCAMIVVAHGLNPVRLADRIYVLDRGTVVEDGTWDQLMARPNGRLASIAAQHPAGDAVVEPNAGAVGE